MFTEQELEQMSINIIRNYLNRAIPELDIRTNYHLAIKRISQNIVDVNKRNGVKAQTQGQRSITYMDSQTYLTDDIKLLLPAPYARMV